jgi:hypothetical protein
VRDWTLAGCVQSASVALVIGLLICARIGDQRQRCFVTGYPGPITRLQDYEGIRGRMHAARRQPSLDQTSLPWRLSRSVINAVDLAGAEFARNAESARPIESSR